MEYKSKFNFKISEAHVVEDTKTRKMAKASLEKLLPLIPEDLDLDANKDLVAIAFNVAVVNTFNKNNDGVSTATAKNMIKLFKNKPINIEHDKFMIVGHIIDANFADMDSNLLKNPPSDDSNEPFQIALSAVLYRSVDNSFVDYVIESSKSGGVSGSWEIAYSDFVIAKGPKEMSAVKIISDAAAIEGMKDRLKTFGGEGVDEDGMSIHTLIVGEALPVGTALTTSPAADVNGIIIGESNKNKEKNKQSVSQKALDNVKTGKQPHNIMDIEKIINDLQEVIATSKASDQEALASSLSKRFAEEIKKVDGDYQAKIKEKEEAVEKEAIAKKELADSVAALKEDLEKTKAELTSVKSEKEETEAVARSEARFREISDEYQLSDEEKEIVKSEVSGLDAEEESFANYKKRVNVLFKGRSKEAIAAQEQEIQKKVTQELKKKLEAHKIDSVEKILASIEPENETPPNTSSNGEESLKDKASRVFGESITIK